MAENISFGKALLGGGASALAGAIQGFTSHKGGSTSFASPAFQVNQAMGYEKPLLDTTQTQLGKETPIREPFMKDESFDARKIDRTDPLRSIDIIHADIANWMTTINKNVGSVFNYVRDIKKDQDGKFRDIRNTFSELAKRDRQLEERFEKLRKDILGRPSGKGEKGDTGEDGRPARDKSLDLLSDVGLAALAKKLAPFLAIALGAGAGVDITRKLEQNKTGKSGQQMTDADRDYVANLPWYQRWSLQTNENVFGGDPIMNDPVLRRRHGIGGAAGSALPDPSGPSYFVNRSGMNIMHPQGNIGTDPQGKGGNETMLPEIVVKPQSNMGPMPSPQSQTKGPGMISGASLMSQGMNWVKNQFNQPNKTFEQQQQKSFGGDNNIPVVTPGNYYGPPSVSRHHSISPIDLLDAMKAITGPFGGSGSSGGYDRGGGKTRFSVGDVSRAVSGADRSYQGRGTSGGYNGPIVQQKGEPSLNLTGLKPELATSLQEGAKIAFGDPSDPNTRYVVTTGGGGGVGLGRGGTSFHNRGLAVDVQIYDREKKAFIGGSSDIMKNAFGNPQTYRQYEVLAQAQYQYNLKTYGKAEADKYSWGGRFGQSKQGTGPDEMHYSYGEGGNLGPITGPVANKQGGAAMLSRGAQSEGMGSNPAEWKSPYRDTKIQGGGTEEHASPNVTQPAAPATAPSQPEQTAQPKQTENQKKITEFQKTAGMGGVGYRFADDIPDRMKSDVQGTGRLEHYPSTITQFGGEQGGKLVSVLKSSLSAAHYSEWEQTGILDPAKLTESEYNKIKQTDPNIAKLVVPTFSQVPKSAPQSDATVSKPQQTENQKKITEFQKTAGMSQQQIQQQKQHASPNVTQPATSLPEIVVKPTKPQQETGRGNVYGKTSISNIENDPSSQAAIQRFAEKFPNVENPKQQLYSLIRGESDFNSQNVTGQYAGYFQLGANEAYSQMGLSKQQFTKLSFAEQMDAYTKWAERNSPKGDTSYLKNVGLFNAASNPALQGKDDNTVVYHAGSAAARANASTWGRYSNAGGDITIGGIKRYYSRNDPQTLRELEASGGHEINKGDGAYGGPPQSQTTSKYVDFSKALAAHAAAHPISTSKQGFGGGDTTSTTSKPIGTSKQGYGGGDTTSTTSKPQSRGGQPSLSDPMWEKFKKDHIRNTSEQINTAALNAQNQLKYLHKGDEPTFAKMTPQHGDKAGQTPKPPQADGGPSGGIGMLPNKKSEPTFSSRFYQQKQTPQTDPIRRLLPEITVHPRHEKSPTFGQLTESPSKSVVARHKTPDAFEMRRDLKSKISSGPGLGKGGQKEGWQVGQEQHEARHEIASGKNTYSGGPSGRGQGVQSKPPQSNLPGSGSGNDQVGPTTHNADQDAGGSGDRGTGDQPDADGIGLCSV